MVVTAVAESRPEALTPEAFRARFGLAKAVAPDAGDDAELPEDRQRETEIWTWFAVTLLAVTIGENLLAHRIRS